MNSFDGQQKSRAFAFVISLALIFAIGCQKKSSKLSGLQDDEEAPTNFDTSYDDTGLTDSLNQGGSTLTDADKSALTNLSAQTADVAPDDGANILSQALAQEMKRLLEEEKAGKDVAAQKMALAGQMMKECSARIAELAPRPGQPLTGSYVGKDCSTKKDVKFDIIDPYDRGKGRGVPNGAPPLYKVSGATNGKMTANAQGSGKIEGTGWQGTVSDTGLNGRAAAGEVVSGRCTMGIGMESTGSRNPIPENYIEAMRRAGACFRQTLFLISPVMDNMFKNMNPALANILKMKMLGFQ